MSVADEIAGLPGGTTLAGLLRSVDGDPGAIRDVAIRWRAAAGDVSGYAGRLRTAVRNIKDVWEGDSADAFDSYMRAYGTAGDGLHDALTSSAADLDAAALALETAESKVGQICGGLLARVSAFVGANPDLDDATYVKTVSSWVAGAEADARKHRDDAEQAVSKAAKKIGDELSGRPATFAAIKAPGDQTFVPAPGHTVYWTPTPLPADGTTSLAAANGGSGAPPAFAGSGSGASPTGAVPVAYNGSGGGGVPQPLTFEPGMGTGAKIVAAAQRHYGAPYIWGANGPTAFDCSGLVYASLNEAGIKIGDTTAAGYQASGKEITGPPQPGDIVFFGQPAHHVGIYVGDGMMIDAPHTGAVVRKEAVAGSGDVVSYRRFT